ncbi:MAG: hypothetical protein M1814_006159 [Vezdaea aestivalis]|nr:MAG: hypothetical protein M1814_006159 [Vezdaea aestivalis]
MEIIYQGNTHKERPNIDVVFVHGLNGHLEGSWTAPELDRSHSTQTFWLEDLLPMDLPNARIISFGHEATFSTLARSDCAAVFDEIAFDLLMDLAARRKRSDEVARPILFVGHCFGGSIIKQALFKSLTEYGSGSEYRSLFSIARSCQGAVFLGTPHGQDAKPSMIRIFDRLGRLSGKSESEIRLSFRYGTSMLENINWDFAAISGHFHLATATQESSSRENIIVPQSSAELGVKDEYTFSIPGSHAGMVQFNANDAGYRRISRRLHLFRELPRRACPASVDWSFRRACSCQPATERPSISRLERDSSGQGSYADGALIPSSNWPSPPAHYQENPKSNLAAQYCEPPFSAPPPPFPQAGPNFPQPHHSVSRSNPVRRETVTHTRIRSPPRPQYPNHNQPPPRFSDVEVIEITRRHNPSTASIFTPDGEYYSDVEEEDEDYDEGYDSDDGPKY